METLNKVGLWFTLQIALLTLAPAAIAQDLNGTLRGMVVDQQGLAVPSVSLVLTNENTNVGVSVRSSAAGLYVFSGLPVGSYALTAEAAGFAQYHHTQIQVRAAQITEVNTVLALSASAVQIRVEAGENVVQTESSQLSGSFEGQPISEIPIATAANLSVLNLAIFLPGTTAALGGTSGTGGSVGGLRGRENSFSIDGVDNNDPDTTT